MTPVPSNNTQKPEPPKNTTGPVQPPAPTNNSKLEPPKNETVPPAPAKIETKPVTPPVEPPKNTTGPTPQPPAKPATNTIASPTNGSAPVPPKPAAPANITANSTKNTTDNKAPAKKTVDYTAYHKLAREEAKKDWRSLTRKTDNNGDGKISFNEILLNYARENGIYID